MNLEWKTDFSSLNMLASNKYQLNHRDALRWVLYSSDQRREREMSREAELPRFARATQMHSNRKIVRIYFFANQFCKSIKSALPKSVWSCPTWVHRLIFDTNFFDCSSEVCSSKRNLPCLLQKEINTAKKCVLRNHPISNSSSYAFLKNRLSICFPNVISGLILQANEL